MDKEQIPDINQQASPQPPWEQSVGAGFKPAPVQNGDKEHPQPVEFLFKLYYDDIVKKIKAGETGLVKELDYLMQLEERLRARNSQSVGAGFKPSPTDDESENEDVGIPEHLRIKRKYTMTPAALEVRRKGGKARAEKNPAPNWKHGKYAKSLITSVVRPCKTTCEKYPCSLIDDGDTEPGDPCLDKAATVQTFKAIMDALKNKKFDDFHEIAAFTISQSIQTVNMLLEDIIRDGTMAKREKYDKDGNVMGYEIVPHPSLLALPKLIADIGMTPQEFMITPRSIAKQGTEEEGLKTIADIMSQVGKTMKKKGDQLKNFTAENAEEK